MNPQTKQAGRKIKKQAAAGHLTLTSSFFANYEKTLSADFQFAQMDLARIRVLRTFINSIAKNLLKLQICLRFYSFYKKLDILAILQSILQNFPKAKHSAAAPEEQSPFRSQQNLRLPLQKYPPHNTIFFL